MYAGDLLLNYPCTPDSIDFSVFLDCLEDIKIWLANNYLQLISDKTVVLVVTFDQNERNVSNMNRMVVQIL